MLTCSYRSLIYILFAWMLAACGGGGGGGGVDPSDGNINTGNSGLRTFSLTLTDTAGTPITEVSDATPGIINALLTDSDGNGVVGEIVTFTLNGNIGSLNPSSGTALTDNNGRAQISLFAGTTGGAATATATARFAIASNLSFSSAGDQPANSDPADASVGTTVTLALTKSSDGETYEFPTEMITQNDPALVTATVTDADGPVAQKAVTFSTTAGEVSLATTLTNTAGQATVTLTAGSIRTAGTVTATYSGVSASEDFETAGDDQASSTDPTVISVTLTDANGAPLPSNTITDATPGQINVTLKRGGSARTNRLVQISATNGLLDPRDSNGVASTITDGNGEASVALTTGGLSGAGEISVVADGAQSNSVIAFVIQSADIQIGDNSSGTFDEGTLEVASSSIASGSTTTVSAYLVDANNNNAIYNTPVEIAFSSSCASNGDAVIDSSSITDGSTGIATVAYVSKGSSGSCRGTDLITATATIGGKAITAQGTIEVTAAAASSIGQEGSANPSVIALQNTSGLGRQTSSTLTFKVLDSNGFAAPNIDVSFEASTTVGGITLTPNEATTLNDGTVQVQVNAGTVPTPVRVRAYFNQGGTEVSTLSEQLSISTGIPDNNSFSLSASELSVLGFNTDGVEVTLTARGADHFQNPTPNDTAFSFISELGGSVDPQCTVTNGQGSCSVTFRTQGTRATADQTPNVTSRGKNDRFGRTTVLAYAIGEESYGDGDGDNRYDHGEIVAQLPEAFIDINENSTRDSTITPAPGNEWSTITFEEFVDYDTNASYTEADDQYNGTLCDPIANDPVDDNHCTDLLNVRDSAVIVSTTRDLKFYIFAGGADTSNINYYESNSSGTATNPPRTLYNTVIGGVTSEHPIATPNNIFGDNAYEGRAHEDNASLIVVEEIDTSVNSSTEITIIVTDLHGNPPANGTSLTFLCSECDFSSNATHVVNNETDLETISLTILSKDPVARDGAVNVTITHPDNTAVDQKLLDINNVR